MKSTVRNTLAELLLKSFDDSETRSAIEWLCVFCEMAARKDRPEVPLGELLRARAKLPPQVDSRVESTLGHLVGPGKLLRLRRADTGEVHSGGISRTAKGIPWLVEPQADARAAFSSVCERARLYADLVAGMGKCGLASSSRDPLRKVMAEAALCFNAGLFFEAHEHLEHSWASQPKGPTKRFLQGIIQISVGFHHACTGKYDGAINQLGKGLEKTLGTTGEFLGLDCDTFLPKVSAVRNAIMARGRTKMRVLLLSEIPRVPIGQ